MKDTERDTFLVAFQEVLKPLFRIAQHFGVPGHDLQDSFSQSAVEFFAEQINKQEGRPASATRVAMYAGLNRSEVIDRITQRGLAAQSLMRRSQMLSSILNAWHTEPGYAGVYDIAREIPFDAEEGKPSFCALIAKVITDADPQELLADLDASRCVEHLDGGFIRPLTRAYVLPAGNLMRIDRLGKVLVNFTESFARDIVGDSTRFSAFAERTLVSDFPLSDKGARIFNDEVRGRGTKFLTELDSWLTSQTAVVEDKAGGRYGCGLYVFEDVASVGRSQILLDTMPGERDPVAFEAGLAQQIVVDVLESTNHRRD